MNAEGFANKGQNALPIYSIFYFEPAAEAGFLAL
jgi:hypothetical protein